MLGTWLLLISTACRPYAWRGCCMMICSCYPRRSRSESGFLHGLLVAHICCCQGSMIDRFNLMWKSELITDVQRCMLESVAIHVADRRMRLYCRAHKEGSPPRGASWCVYNVDKAKLRCSGKVIPSLLLH